MKNNINTILNVIVNTFEETKNIKIHTLYEEDGHIYGLYTNDVGETLSFNTIPDINFQTDLEGYSIHLFELGNILYNIYNNASSSLFFVKMLLHDNYLTDLDDYYIEIIDFVRNNIPFFLVKAWIIEQIDNVDIDEPLSSNVLLQNIMSNVQMFIELSDLDSDFDVDSFLGKKDDDILVFEVVNDLMVFKSLLMEQEYGRVSEIDIKQLNDLFIYLQYMQIDIV